MFRIIQLSFVMDHTSEWFYNSVQQWKSTPETYTAVDISKSLGLFGFDTWASLEPSTL